VIYCSSIATVLGSALVVPESLRFSLCSPEKESHDEWSYCRVNLCLSRTLGSWSCDGQWKKKKTPNLRLNILLLLYYAPILDTFALLHSICMPHYIHKKTRLQTRLHNCSLNQLPDYDVPIPTPWRGSKTGTMRFGADRSAVK
jgi:hypothetical protein